tara:strand:+ start:802 stop:1011 length:210 start_codon:yes stop_codon:yes gene_type:complete
MPTYQIHCTAAIEIYATVDADSIEHAKRIASNITIVNYANETVGAETDDGEITEVIGHEVAGITITGGE